MYLGVDGGGSKTAFVIVSNNGEIVAEHEEAGSYYLDIGMDGLRTLIDVGVITVLAKAGLSPSDISYAFFGLPAYGEDSKLIKELDAIPGHLLTQGNYRCDNDMVCAWAGALACQDGISLIAGTGSIGFGRFAGKSARSGGWGEIFGDEGSAYWIACKGLQLFSKMSDGRAARGPLYDLVRLEYSLPQDLDLSTLVISTWAADRSRIAAFSRVLFQAAQDGDRQVRDIFHCAANELVEIVEAIRAQLNVPAHAEVIISYAGGIFNAGDLITGPLASGLRASQGRYSFCAPKYSPALGAAYYAAVLDDCAAIESMLLHA